MKLSTLTPDSVANDVRDAINNYVSSLAMRCNLGGLDTPWPCESIVLSARDLAAYAISGAALDAPAIDYVQSLAEALYIRPADSGTYDTGDLLGDSDANTSWGVVIRAALARAAIASGDDVKSGDLAVLASITGNGVRKLILSGEIRTRKHRDDSAPGKPASEITATEARRWLSGRGVAGF